MKTKTIAYILALMFLVASLFTSYGVCIICASIFCSAYLTIETIEKNRNKYDKIKSKVWLLHESYFTSLKFGHSEENCQKYLDEIERILREEINKK